MHIVLQGLDHPTPTIDHFLGDIFNKDQALIDFLQRLWGYSINGRTTAELMVFLLGSGGKSESLSCKVRRRSSSAAPLNIAVQ